MGVPSRKVLDKVISFRTRHRSKIALQRRHPQHEVDRDEEGFNDSVDVDGRTDTPPVGVY